MIKFDSIFAQDGGPVPDDALITEAFLLIDTATPERDQNAGTNGNYSVHAVQRDWDLSTVYGDFGGNGPDELQGEIGPALDLTGALIADARTELDVTEAVQAWQGGASNFGFNIQAADTADGWAFKWLASDSPPQLVVNFTDEIPNLADINQDGTVDIADFDLMSSAFGETGNNLPADIDGDQSVGLSDFVILVERFGTSADGAPAQAVPEPSVWLLGLFLLAAVPLFRKLRK